MTSEDKLADYRKKRDFQKTAEPQGAKGKAGGKPIFVIQKHDASSLHYDFRLQVDGVLKSWAVPKGPSTDPRDKRLAVMTEDHPLDYADFEGVIPEGEYGAGTVLVWDKGTYHIPDDEKPDPEKTLEEELASGHAHFWLNGEKLQGGYTLIKMKKGGEKNWLLVKIDDEEADARRNPVSTEPDSVISGRSLKDLAAKKNQE